MAGTDRLRGLDVLLHDGTEDGGFAVVEHEGRQDDTDHTAVGDLSAGREGRQPGRGKEDG